MSHSLENLLRSLIHPYITVDTSIFFLLECLYLCCPHLVINFFREDPGTFLEGVSLTGETSEPFPPPEGKVGPSASSMRRNVKMPHGNKGSQLFSKAQMDMPRSHLGEAMETVSQNPGLIYVSQSSPVRYSTHLQFCYFLFQGFWIRARIIEFC